MQGIDRTDVIERAGEIFGIHNLILEDILNSAQRPKAEVYDDILSVFVKLLSLKTGENSLEVEHISIILKGKLVILRIAVSI